MKKEIKNGDVFDIGQTINGVSKFLWFNDKWYYFEERITSEYEYDQEGLTKIILDSGYFGDVFHLGNILSTFEIE